jgi:hypothetical protein
VSSSFSRTWMVGFGSFDTVCLVAMFVFQLQLWTDLEFRSGNLVSFLHEAFIGLCSLD